MYLHARYADRYSNCHGASKRLVIYSSRKIEPLLEAFWSGGSRLATAAGRERAACAPVICRIVNLPGLLQFMFVALANGGQRYHIADHLADTPGEIAQSRAWSGLSL